VCALVGHTVTAES